MLDPVLNCLMIRKVIQNLEIRQNDFIIPLLGHCLRKKRSCSILSPQTERGNEVDGQIHQRGEKGPLETQDFQGEPRVPNKEKQSENAQGVFPIG